jgi:hypothetical protein
LRKGRFVREQSPQASRKGARPVPYEFDHWKMKDCTAIAQ